MTEQLSGDLKFIPGVGKFNIDPLKLRKTSYGGAASLKNKSPRRVVGEVKKEYPGPIYKDIDLGKFKYKNETVGLPKATTKRTERIAKEDKDRVFEGYGNEKDKKKEGLNIYVREKSP